MPNQGKFSSAELCLKLSNKSCFSELSTLFLHTEEIRQGNFNAMGPGCELVAVPTLTALGQD